MNAGKVICFAERLIVPATVIGCACALAGAAMTRQHDPSQSKKSYSMSVVEFDGHRWVQGDWGSIVHHPDCECGSNK